MTCPICGNATAPLFAKGPYWIERCTGCGHRCAAVASPADHVRATYGDDYFTGGGAGYSDYLGEERLLRERGRWYAALLLRQMRPGRVLDVGAAAGFILMGLADGGWSGAGLEPNAGMASHARTLGLDVETGTLESWRRTERFDAISMIQVVAHFVDPRRAFAAAAEATRPGGCWLIETWDRDSWPARLLGRHWHEYSPPSVLHWYSRQGLARLANDFGFAPIAHGRPPKWISGDHVRSLLPHALEGSPFAGAARHAVKLVPARLAIPYPTWDLFWMLLRRRR